MGFVSIDINDAVKTRNAENARLKKAPFPFVGFHNCIFNLSDVRGLTVVSYLERYSVLMCFDYGVNHKISPDFSTEEEAQDYMLKAWGIILETLENF